jgi:peptidoglycan/LPS O-acetylase OafA/YrhL
MKYIPGLNGLRALAVICVVIYHWGCPFLSHYSLTYILPDGMFGVNVFFVLSGFLISSILFIEKKKLSETHPSRKVIVSFYIRRILRISPIYYLLVAFVYLFKIPDFNQNLVYYLTYTENFNMFFKKGPDFFMHVWSLSVEEQFYLIWPVILIFSNQKHILKILFFFIFLGPASSFAQTYIFKNPLVVYYLTPECFDSFGIGALLAYCYMENKLDKIKRVVKILLPFSILIFFYWNLAENGGHFKYFKRFTESIIASGAILFCLSERYKKIRNILLENRILVQLGIVSYGIYLFHYTLPYFYFKAKTSLGFTRGSIESRSDYSLMIFILLALAFLSYYFLEKPIMAIKNRFTY